MVTIIIFVAKNSDGRGASSINSSPASSPYAAQAHIFLAAAAKGILLKCVSNHVTPLLKVPREPGSKPKPSQKATSPPWSALSLPLCPHLLRAPPTLAPWAFCGSRTPRHTPALGSWHCRPLCLEPIFLRHLSASFVPPPSRLCSNAILPTRPAWPLCFYFLFLFFTFIFIYLCVYVWLHWVFVAT